MERVVQKNKEEIKGRKKSLGENGSSDSKESTHNAGDLGSIPGLGRSPEEGNGNSLHILFVLCVSHSVVSDPL